MTNTPLGAAHDPNATVTPFAVRSSLDLDMLTVGHGAFGGVPREGISQSVCGSRERDAFPYTSTFGVVFA